MGQPCGDFTLRLHKEFTIKMDNSLEKVSKLNQASNNTLHE
ncbi:hypothetical protein SAMN05518848_108100 [Paenibacillus sp. PDC88]|nr:hypothetical protein SAMN05518848_108100 [Paenibacillus sp. PDC88]